MALQKIRPNASKDNAADCGVLFWVGTARETAASGKTRAGRTQFRRIGASFAFFADAGWAVHLTHERLRPVVARRYLSLLSGAYAMQPTAKFKVVGVCADGKTVVVVEQETREGAEI